MSKYLPMKLTTQGKRLLANVQSGVGNIKIIRFETGSGTYEPGEDYSLREALKEPRQKFSISSKTVETDDSIVLEVEVTNCPEDGEGLETGYKIREMAFFAENPEGGEICYCIMVGTDDLMMDYLPAYDGTIPSTITNYFHIKVANAGEVEIVIKSGEVVNSQEGANGLRVYQGKLQYLNSRGEWQDIDTDASAMTVENIPEVQEEFPEVKAGSSIGKLFGIIKKWQKDCLNRFGRVLIGPADTELFNNDTLFIVEEQENTEFERAGTENIIFSESVPDAGENWAEIGVTGGGRAGTMNNFITGKLVASEKEDPDATFFAKINKF